MSNLLEQLRLLSANAPVQFCDSANLMSQAADRIETLEHDNKKLHEMIARYEDALREIANHPNIDALGSWQVRSIAGLALESPKE